jgi:hypothetical protein
VHVRVDEPRREREPGSVDHAMSVAIERRADLRDRAVVDADVDRRVDCFERIDDTRAGDQEVLCGCVLAYEHQATS